MTIPPLIPSGRIGHITTMRCIVVAFLALLLLVAPAGAQGVIVVPAGAEVVVPPRGAGPAPRPPLARAGVARPLPARPVRAQAGGGQAMALSGTPLGAPMGLGAPAFMALPLAAAAAVAAGSLPGGGGGTTAPARTR
ncbi:MAG: hypothetical protein N3D18_05255 [Roseococcus sp.]|nr:hypothetical protein [Roseococcus sp.]